MGSTPISLEAAARISERATRYARENMKRKGWSTRSQQAIVPYTRPGKPGIRATAPHLMFQNKGIAPFLMTALEGKTVPIKGQLFKVKGVGLPGWGYQDRKHNPVKGPVWRDQRWRHPGIQPERFLENSLSRAILEMMPAIRQEMIEEIRRGTDSR